MDPVATQLPNPWIGLEEHPRISLQGEILGTPQQVEKLRLNPKEKEAFSSIEAGMDRLREIMERARNIKKQVSIECLLAETE